MKTRSTAKLNKKEGKSKKSNESNENIEEENDIIVKNVDDDDGDDFVELEKKYCDKIINNSMNLNTSFVLLFITCIISF